MGASNRETNEASMKLGTLQTITYPTGGNTTFEYEANDYYNPTGIKVLRDTATLNHFWDGGNCGIDNTSTNNILKAFTQVELDNMFYKIDARKATLYTATCADPSPSYQIKVFFTSGAPACASSSITPSSTILSGAGTSTVTYQIKTTTGKLTDLFPCLVTNTTYRFEIVGTNSAVNFTLQQEVTVGTITNRKVGGLRV